MSFIEFVISSAGIPFLGAIPLDPRIGKSCDQGISFLEEYPDSPATKAYAGIVDSTSFSFPIAKHSSPRHVD